MSKFPPPEPSIRVKCPNCGRFLGKIAGHAEFPPCHNCGWQTTISPPPPRLAPPPAWDPADYFTPTQQYPPPLNPRSKVCLSPKPPLQ